MAAGKDETNLALKLLFLLATTATNISRAYFQRMRSHSTQNSLALGHQKTSTRQWKILYRSREAGKGNTRRKDDQQLAKEMMKVVGRAFSAAHQMDQGLK